jgi:hypothetical protein
VYNIAVKSVASLQLCVQLQAEYNSLTMLFSNWSLSASDKSCDVSDVADVFHSGLGVIGAVGSKLLLLLQVSIFVKTQKGFFI